MFLTTVFDRRLDSLTVRQPCLDSVCYHLTQAAAQATGLVVCNVPCAPGTQLNSALRASIIQANIRLAATHQNHVTEIRHALTHLLQRCNDLLRKIGHKVRGDRVSCHHAGGWARGPHWRHFAWSFRVAATWAAIRYGRRAKYGRLSMSDQAQRTPLVL